MGYVVERGFIINAGEKTTRNRLIAGMPRLGYKQLTSELPLRFQRSRRAPFSMSLMHFKTTAKIDLSSPNARTTNVMVTLEPRSGYEGSRFYDYQFWRKEVDVMEAIARNSNEPTAQSLIDLDRKMAKRLLAFAVLALGGLLVEWVWIIQPQLSKIGQSYVPLGQVFQFVATVGYSLLLIVGGVGVSNTIRHVWLTQRKF